MWNHRVPKLLAYLISIPSLFWKLLILGSLISNYKSSISAPVWNLEPSLNTEMLKWGLSEL